MSPGKKSQADGDISDNASLVKCTPEAHACLEMHQEMSCFKNLCDFLGSSSVAKCATCQMSTCSCAECHAIAQPRNFRFFFSGKSLGT
jgi:hypothetical protein